MKANSQLIRLLTVVIVTTLSVSSASAYDITLNWLGENPPLIFPVGRFVPGDLSEAGYVEFQNIEPFFEMTITGTGEEDILCLWVRMESDDGGEMFAVRSRPFSIEEKNIIGRTLNNQALALDPEISLGSGGYIERADMLAFIDGRNVREGYYTLTVLLSDQCDQDSDWGSALASNYGLLRTATSATMIIITELISPNSNVCPKTSSDFSCCLSPVKCATSAVVPTAMPITNIIRTDITVPAIESAATSI